MKQVFTLFSLFLLPFALIGQDGLNQVVVVNGGQFGNPSERANLAVYDPVGMTYTVIDTLPSNSIQDLLISGDIAYIAAQNVLLKYDLDTGELLASVDFPGISAHQLYLWEDVLFATNFYAQASDNLYVFDAGTLEVQDTISEILHPGGTMAAIDGKLYISQNQKGSTDGCPPFGCFNDTLGYLAVIDLSSLQWEADVALSNNGNECGRIVRNGNLIVSLNEVSNTVTSYEPSSGLSQTDALTDDITTARYRTEAKVIAGSIISLFNGGIGILDNSDQTVAMAVDTPVIAFAFDEVNNHYYATYTDFFTTNAGYAFDATGNFLFDFPVGEAPEAIAMQYNHQPVGLSSEAESADTVWFDVNAIAFDPDGDGLRATEIINAPINGVLTLYSDGRVRYVSFSPGSADAFRLKICDDKLNPLCSFITVTISPISSAFDSALSEILVYPNPVRHQLQVRKPVEGVRYTIYDPLGKALMATDDPSQLDFSGYASGSYILRMEKGADRKAFRIQKL